MKVVMSKIDPELKKKLLKESHSPFKGLRRVLWIAFSGSAFLGLLIMLSKIASGSELQQNNLLIQIGAGILLRNCSLRVIRSEKVIFEGNLDSLKRSKDDVKEVNTGFECGVGCDKFSSWVNGDIIEAFKYVTKKRTLTQ